MDIRVKQTYVKVRRFFRRNMLNQIHSYTAPKKFLANWMNIYSNIENVSVCT